MAAIRIYFQGVAVHLIGVVPGVPCRVVLPDATASYIYEDEVLDRHFTSIQWASSDGTQNSVPFFREWFTVGNPVTPQDFKLDPSMAALYHLDHWVPNLQLSSEVIYAGRTALYFDIFYGTLACHYMEPSGALFTSLTVDVTGDPFLIRVPFHYASFDFDPTPPMPQPWPMPSDDISVVNMGTGCRGSRNDFALSFLVTRGGIPRGLKDLPGQNGGPPPLLPKGSFAAHDVTKTPKIVLDSLSAACSASSFPRPG